MAALRTFFHNAAILNVITPTATSLWQTGVSTSNPGIGALPPTIMNEAVAILALGAGDPRPRWAAFAGYHSTTPGTTSLRFYDLGQPLSQITSTQISFDLIDPTNQSDTRPVDLDLSADGRDLILRLSSPPDEPDPAAGGRDWYRFRTTTVTPPALVGFGLGGKGTCVGIDCLREQRTAAVSISAHSTNPNQGFVHIVHAGFQ